MIWFNPSIFRRNTQQHLYCLVFFFLNACHESLSRSLFLQGKYCLSKKKRHNVVCCPQSIISMCSLADHSQRNHRGGDLEIARWTHFIKWYLSVLRGICRSAGFLGITCRLNKQSFLGIQALPSTMGNKLLDKCETKEDSKKLVMWV